MTLTPESMAHLAALWSWCVRADAGMSMVSVAKLDDEEVAECLDAAERMTGWLHLRQMVLQRQRLTAMAALTPDAEVAV